MSIGKNSIARAVSVTKDAPAQAKAQSNNLIIQKFNIDEIGLLSENASASLNDSIKKHGILCPLLVAITEKGDKWLLDGYARLSAAKALNISEVDAVVVNVTNKNDVNRLYKELVSLKPKATDSIHQEKFKVLAVKDHDLPAYLL